MNNSLHYHSRMTRSSRPDFVAPVWRAPRPWPAVPASCSACQPAPTPSGPARPLRRRAPKSETTAASPPRPAASHRPTSALTSPRLPESERTALRHLSTPAGSSTASSCARCGPVARRCYCSCRATRRPWEGAPPLLRPEQGALVTTGRRRPLHRRRRRQARWRQLLPRRRDQGRDRDSGSRLAAGCRQDAGPGLLHHDSPRTRWALHDRAVCRRVSG